MTGITATRATKGLEYKVMDTCGTTIAVRNVLFATDFSQEADHAISYVRGLRYAFGARVYVVNVVDTFPYNLGDGESAEIISRRHAQAEQRLSDYVRSHHFDGRHFSQAVLEGEVFAAIDRFVLQNEIDLVVLGSRAALGLDRLFLGSTAEEIFRTAHCPVLVVGPKAEEARKDGRFNRLLFATDFSEHSKAALPYVEFLLATNRNAVVTLAHVLRRDKMSLLERHRAQRVLEGQLRSLLPPAFQPQIADVIVEWAPPAQAMAEVSAGIAADLLVLGVRYGGSFLRAATHGLASVTHEVLAKARCPVLTVRSGMTVPDAHT